MKPSYHVEKTMSFSLTRFAIEVVLIKSTILAVFGHALSAARNLSDLT